MRTRLCVLSFLLAAAIATLANHPLPAEQAADPANDITAADQEILRSAGVATDAAGLVGYLRKSVLTEADRAKIEGLVQQLASDRFAAREEATEKLVAIGHPAIPFLRLAARNSNREVASRAE